MQKDKDTIVNLLILLFGILMLYGVFKPYFIPEYKGEGEKGGSQLIEGIKPSHAAIAFSPDTLAWGSSRGYDDKEDAIRDALLRCGESGATDCEHKTWFYDSCGSLAVEPKSNADGRGGAWGIGRGSSQQIADESAMKFCSKYGSGCKIVESICVP